MKKISRPEYKDSGYWIYKVCDEGFIEPNTAHKTRVRQRHTI